MKIDDIKNINLPNKKSEEFLKINFDSLFSYEFKNVQNYEFDNLHLKIQEDNNSYKSVLFDITKIIEKNQKVLELEKSTTKPIILINHLKNDETFCTNSLKIDIKKDVKACIIEVFVSSSTNSCFGVNRIINLEKNASLEYIKIQDINSLNSMIFCNSSNQEENSNLQIFNFELSDGFIVNSFENLINKEFVYYKLNGLIKLNKNASNSTLIQTIHNKENSQSNINYKNSLKDNSRAVIKIKSIVNKNARFTKAFQNCNTILLSNNATIFAQPHLEIFIDELEASHGATTGTLNEEQLLYLQSRGINKDKAYDMLLVAFESSIKDNIENKNAKKFVEEYNRSNYV